jgi:hypothetical protein
MYFSKYKLLLPKLLSKILVLEISKVKEGTRFISAYFINLFVLQVCYSRLGELNI